MVTGSSRARLHPGFVTTKSLVVNVSNSPGLGGVFSSGQPLPSHAWSEGICGMCSVWLIPAKGRAARLIIDLLKTGRAARDSSSATN